MVVERFPKYLRKNLSKESFFSKDSGFKSCIGSHRYDFQFKNDFIKTPIASANVMSLHEVDFTEA